MQKEKGGKKPKMKLKDPNFSPLESCWIIEKNRSSKQLYCTHIHANVLEEERKQEKERTVLGWYGWWQKNIPPEAGYLESKILWQNVLISNGNFSFLVSLLLPFTNTKRPVPTLAFLQLTKPTATKSKTLVSESRDFKFLRLERGNERKRKKGRRKENHAAGSLGD